VLIYDPTGPLALREEDKKRDHVEKEVFVSRRRNQGKDLHQSGGINPEGTRSKDENAGPGTLARRISLGETFFSGKRGGRTRAALKELIEKELRGGPCARSRNVS